LRQRLVAIFDDKDENNCKSLEKTIAEIPGIETLKYKPEVHNEEVGEKIVRMFENMELIPTLFFVDPWGYKGLSLRLVDAFLKDWGCDCIFFFNYNRINMGLNNPLVQTHIEALFGKQRADSLREKLLTLRPNQRELTIVEELCQALRAIGGNFILPFCFKNKQGNRTSHHLIFITKNFKGYEIMKEIMARESSLSEQGVPTFEFCPGEKQQPLLFELNRPLDELERLLLNEFAGKKLTMDEVYLQHNVGRRFIKKNYKDVLKRMEIEGKINTLPPSTERRNNTFGDKVLITFP